MAGQWQPGMAWADADSDDEQPQPMKPKVAPGKNQQMPTPMAMQNQSQQQTQNQQGQQQMMMMPMGMMGQPMMGQQQPMMGQPMMGQQQMMMMPMGMQQGQQMMGMQQGQQMMMPMGMGQQMMVPMAMAGQQGQQGMPMMMMVMPNGQPMMQGQQMMQQQPVAWAGQQTCQPAPAPAGNTSSQEPVSKAAASKAKEPKRGAKLKNGKLGGSNDAPKVDDACDGNSSVTSEKPSEKPAPAEAAQTEAPSAPCKEKALRHALLQRQASEVVARLRQSGARRAGLADSAAQLRHSTFSALNLEVSSSSRRNNTAVHPLRRQSLAEFQKELKDAQKKKEASEKAAMISCPQEVGTKARQSVSAALLHQPGPLARKQMWTDLPNLTILLQREIGPPVTL